MNEIFFDENDVAQMMDAKEAELYRRAFAEGRDIWPVLLQCERANGGFSDDRM